MAVEGQTTTDQRRSRRFRARLPVDVTQGQVTKRVSSVDVSRHGIFIATESPPPHRFLVRVSIHLLDGPLEANAFVSRRVVDKEPQGAGLQFFAMASAAKERWDRYIAQMSGATFRPGAKVAAGLPAPKGPLGEEVEEMASFMVKLPSLDRLEAFFDRAATTRSVYMVTPLIRPIASPVAVVLIHPSTSDEFILTGRVRRVRTSTPRGIEIHVDEIAPSTREAFAAFLLARDSAPPSLDPGPVAASIDRAPSGVDIDIEESVDLDLPFDPPVDHPSSHPPPPLEARTASEEQDGEPQQRSAVPPGPPADLATDFDDPSGSISVDLAGFPPVDEARITDNERFEWEQVSGDLIVDLDLSELEERKPKPAPIPASLVDSIDAGPNVADPNRPTMDALLEGLVPPLLVLRLRCTACGKTDRVETGAPHGALRLFTRYRPYWCPGCRRIVTVPRLTPASTRHEIRDRIITHAPAALATGGLELAFAVGDLAHPPRCPDCQCTMKINQSVARFEAAVDRIGSETNVLIPEVPCRTCDGEELLLERL